jgi:hypothetical protein
MGLKPILRLVLQIRQLKLTAMDRRCGRVPSLLALANGNIIEKPERMYLTIKKTAVVFFRCGF